ncbi:hypothetical protein TRFO_18460 [Tritrichomonas foetus]|uniref:Uncharacterized protein n=1 Tax=Tritrichomonas foetus TaxID=1144522 RepID=A0A1J4KLS3_9EUKA|nr:hypothetical protein [Tritrichomonas foetus]OHT11888.1 hypothetical protein TRFO_18460 [Tritrichomonas foetus]|eukprot:OHT11888.1 hypothetical protein TRFO_18460 [Tritrichomonas foetus]
MIKDHPEYISTRIYRKFPLPIKKLIRNKYFQPVSFIILAILFLGILPKYIIQNCGDEIDGVNGIFRTDMRYKYLVNLYPKNRWSELNLFVRQHATQDLKPYIEDETGLIDRFTYFFEFSRLLGLDPYHHEFVKKAHTLIIGDQTPIGYSLMKYLNKSGDFNYAHIGCQESFSLDSYDSYRILEIVNISSIFVTCEDTNVILLKQKFPNATITVALEKGRVHDYRYKLDDINFFMFDSFLYGHNSLVHSNFEKCQKIKTKNDKTKPVIHVNVAEDDQLSDISADKSIQFIFDQIKNSNKPIHQFIKSSKKMNFKEVFDILLKNECQIEYNQPTNTSKLDLDSDPKLEQVSLKGKTNAIFQYLKTLKEETHISKNVYVSFVASLTNSNFSNEKFNKFLESISNGMKYFSDFEIIFVTLNLDFLKLEIPNSIKEKVKFLDIKNKYQNNYLSKFNSTQYETLLLNYGVSESKGEFVLLTNLNVQFDDETLFSKFLSKKDLNKGIFYTSRNSKCRKNVETEALTIYFTNKHQHFVCGMKDFSFMSKDLFSAIDGFKTGIEDSNIEADLISKLYLMVNGFAHATLDTQVSTDEEKLFSYVFLNENKGIVEY